MEGYQAIWKDFNIRSQEIQTQKRIQRFPVRYIPQGNLDDEVSS